MFENKIIKESLHSLKKLLRRNMDISVAAALEGSFKNYSEDTVNAPSKMLCSLEFPRTLIEMGMHYLSLPLHSKAPKGDGHAVMVIPGFGAHDVATAPLRKFLEKCGYKAFGWEQGINTGYNKELGDGLADVLFRIFNEHGKVSLVGHSLGGVYAREIARLHTKVIRNVITMGSPFTEIENSNNLVSLYNFINGKSHKSKILAKFKMLHLAPPVPTTAVYSKSDGIVAWQSTQHDDKVKMPHEKTENIAVKGSHCGMIYNPMVLWILADRLSQEENDWKPFSLSRFDRYLARKKRNHYKELAS